MKAKRILVTPLDWGLGHATRCIPVIRLLVDEGHQVFIAGTGSSLQLLKAEFPSLSFANLPGYSPVYPRGKGMVMKMLTQLPKFANAIRREHRALSDLVNDLRIDIVISDNRYGCWTPKATSVFITHQSNIFMPKRFGLLSPLIRRLNHYLMNNFDIIWIPDHPGAESVGGQLISFGYADFRKKVCYIGNLSRFKTTMGIEKKYDVVAICSGPEPQRSMLEDILLTQLLASNLIFILVRGIVREGTEQAYPNGSRVINYLTSSALEMLLQEGRVIISRSGYSTVMDLIALQAKAIFIPTPGQTEQEYLASRLEQMGIAYSVEQGKFNLVDALQASTSFKGFVGYQREDLLTPSLGNLLSTLPPETSLLEIRN